MLDKIFTLVSQISGVVSLVTVLLLIGIWKGHVDADRAAWKKVCEAYPPAELWRMCTTMWEIYVVDTLHKRPDLAERKSPWRLKSAGIEMIPKAIKEELDKITQIPESQEDIASGWLVVKSVGIDHIYDMAKEKHLSVQEAVAVLSTYLDERIDHYERREVKCQPSS